MNSANSDSLATSASSGHRDPKSLLGYVKKGPSLKMKGARSIAAELSSSSRATFPEASLTGTKRKREDKACEDSFFEDDVESSDCSN